MKFIKRIAMLALAVMAPLSCFAVTNDLGELVTESVSSVSGYVLVGIAAGLTIWVLLFGIRKTKSGVTSAAGR